MKIEISATRLRRVSIARGSGVKIITENAIIIYDMATAN